MKSQQITQITRIKQTAFEPQTRGGKTQDGNLKIKWNWEDNFPKCVEGCTKKGNAAANMCKLGSC